MRSLIACIDHGVYGVSPECDQPMWAGEAITLQTVDCGPGEQDLLRLVHSRCVEDDEDEDED